MWIAFPSSDYAEANVAKMSGFFDNIGHAISLNDVVTDTVGRCRLTLSNPS
jgi:hypothetical protein